MPTPRCSAASRDRVRPRVLSDREDRVRVRLPVRSGEGHRATSARRCASSNSLDLPKDERDKIYFKNLGRYGVGIRPRPPAVAAEVTPVSSF